MKSETPPDGPQTGVKDAPLEPNWLTQFRFGEELRGAGRSNHGLSPRAGYLQHERLLSPFVHHLASGVLRREGDVQLIDTQIEQAMVWTKKEIQKISNEIDANIKDGLDTSQLEKKKFEYIQCLNDLEHKLEKKKGPNQLIPASMAALNGIIAIGVGWYYLTVLDMFGVLFFELLIIIMCSSLLIGAGLIATRRYKAGTILCMIGGILTVPIGMLGILAAQKAWEYSKDE